MDAWTDGPQLLVGQSLGGLTAAAVAASRPDLVDELVVIDITPGVDPNAGPTQIREFFAGPDGLGVARRARRPGALASGSAGRARRPSAACTSTRASAPTGGSSGSTTSRTCRRPWPPPRNSPPLPAAAAGRGLRRADRDRLGRPRGRRRADHARPRRPRLRHRGGCRAVPRRVPAASVATCSSGHNVQEELPVELGRAPREPSRGRVNACVAFRVAERMTTFAGSLGWTIGPT